MAKILEEDIKRIHELIYGKILLEDDNRLIDKVKNTVNNIIGKKENPVTVQNIQRTQQPQPQPQHPIYDFIKNPLSHIQSKFSHLKTAQPKGPVLFKNGYTQLNLLNNHDYVIYSQICQTFINRRNSNAGINGNMMASAAKNVYQATKKYIPPELALAQLALEGGLNNDLNAKPIRTNNPFNIGHYDNGRTVSFKTKQEGINKYYELIAKNYLSTGRTVAQLAQNFVNIRGYRYASASNYESKLRQIMKEVNNISLSIISTKI